MVERIGDCERAARKIILKQHNGKIYFQELTSLLVY